MSDSVDLAFESLRGQRPPAPFAPPEAIRRRGRQRAIRQATAAGFAVLVTLGGGVAGAAAVVGRGPGPGNPPATMPPSTVTASPSPHPQPSGSHGLGTAQPTPTDLASLLLRVEDLGAGRWRAFPLYEPFSSADLWYWAGICPAYRSADYPSLRHMSDVVTTGFDRGDAYVHQHVTRYAAGWGSHAFDDTRKVLNRCAGSPSPSPSAGAAAPPHYRIIDSGFAGDESILIREETFPYAGESLAPRPDVSLIVVVRVGDVLALLQLAPVLDEAYAHQIAINAVARLTAR